MRKRSDLKPLLCQQTDRQTDRQRYTDTQRESTDAAFAVACHVFVEKILWHTAYSGEAMAIPQSPSVF